jgi:hypothetical protein
LIALLARTLTVYTPVYEMASAAKRFGEIADGARRKAQKAVQAMQKRVAWRKA